MRSPRRYLAFSLRTLFILLTAFAVWLGVVVNRAREQREAVEAIEALGGSVQYDWEQTPPPNEFMFGEVMPPGPGWLRRLIGDDFFQEPREVDFFYSKTISAADVLKSIPHLQRMKGIREVRVHFRLTETQCARLNAALPSCVIGSLGP